MYALVNWKRSFGSYAQVCSRSVQEFVNARVHLMSFVGLYALEQYRKVLWHIIYRLIGIVLLASLCVD